MPPDDRLSEAQEKSPNIQARFLDGGTGKTKILFTILSNLFKMHKIHIFMACIISLASVIRTGNPLVR